MDDDVTNRNKDEKKEEKDTVDSEETESEEFKTEEPDSPGTQTDEVEEAMPEETSGEQPRKFFHSSQSQPEIYAGQQRGGSRKKIFLVLVVLALLAVGSFFYSVRSGSKDTSKSSPTPVPVVQPPPAPSPSPSFDRSAHKIRVLNGTSVQGRAASVSAKLKDLGYEIEKTGNATNSAFLKTVVRVKSGIEGILQALIEDLAPDFKAEEGPGLKDSDTSDGEVILGED